MNQRKLNCYIREIKTLTEIDISAKDLLSIEDMNESREHVKNLSSNCLIKFTERFSVLTQDRFLKFISKLNSFNRASIYIWTNNSNDCGLFEIESLSKIDWNFPFDLNEGIIVFVASNYKDRMTLDFYENDGGEKMLDIEMQGENWPQAKLEDQ